MKMKKILTIILTAAMTVSLAACGSSAQSGAKEEAAESKTEETASTETAVEETSANGDQKVFKFGGIMPVTGELAIMGTEDKQGVEMAIDEINAAGGLDVGGEKYKIEFISYDAGADPQDSADYTQRLINVDGCNIICGSMMGPNLPAELEVSEPAGVIVYDSFARNPILSGGSKYGIEMNSPCGAIGHAFVDLLRKDVNELNQAGLPGERMNAAQSIAVFGRNESYTVDFANGVEEQCEKSGVKYAGNIMFPTGTTDYLPYIQQLAALDPDVVVLYSYTEETMLPPLRDMLAVGGLDWTKGDIVLMSNDVLAEPSAVQRCHEEGVDINGMICYSSVPLEANQAALDFYEKGRQKYGDKFGLQPALIFQSYEATMQVLGGISLSGTVTDTDKMLQGIKDYSYKGAYYDWVITDEKQSQTPIYINRVENDVLVTTGIEYGQEVYWGAAFEYNP